MQKCQTSNVLHACRTLGDQGGLDEQGLREVRRRRLGSLPGGAATMAAAAAAGSGAFEDILDGIRSVIDLVGANRAADLGGAAGPVGAARGPGEQRSRGRGLELRGAALESRGRGLEV